MTLSSLARWKRSCAAGVGLWCVVLPISFHTGLARAEQWEIRPNASFGLRYDDNVRLRVENPESSLIGRAAAGVRAMRRAEANSLGITAGIFADRYSDVSELNNVGGFLTTEAGYETDRDLVGVDVRFDSQPTLTSEEQTSGLLQVNKRRNRFIVSPSWTHLLSERASLDIDLAYMDVIYEDVQDIPLFDYRLGAASLFGSYRLTERATLNGQVRFGRYEARDVSNEYDNVDVGVGADYLVTETLSVGALLGVRSTTGTFGSFPDDSVSQDSSGPTYSLDVNKRFNGGGILNLQGVRELAPSGTGELLDTTELRLKLDYPLSSRWRVLLYMNGYRNREPGGERTRSDRKFISATPRIVYRVSETWNLSAGYRYRWQKRDLDTDEAVSNAVFLTLSWTRPWDL